MDTNDMLQGRRPPKAIFPNMCVMCGVSSEFLALFCNFFMACFVWYFGECRVRPRSLDQFMLASFTGRRKGAKFWWQCAIYATFWCVWLDHDPRIFKEIPLDELLLWEKDGCLVSIWCKACGPFKG